MAELQDMMTNEKLMKGRFGNQFSLVNYAIGRAKRMVHSGVNPKVRTGIGNKAYQVLEEIAQNRDLLDQDDLNQNGAESSKNETGTDSAIL